jgi:hypothetical protein
VFVEVTAPAELAPLFDCGVITTEYGAAAKAAGKVIVPAELFDVTVPHCISNPFGILVYPEVAILAVPRTNELDDNVAFVENTLVATTLPKVVLPENEAPLEIAFNVVVPSTETFLVKVVLVLTLTAREFTETALTEELPPRIIPSVVESITILAAALLPVWSVRSVEPSIVLIVVVVKLDIRLIPPFRQFQLLD